MRKKSEATHFLDNLIAAASRFEDRSLEEIREDLRAQGIDPDEALSRFAQILSVHAPTWKQRAERERMAAEQTVRAFREKIRLSREQLVARIKQTVEFIRQHGGSVQVGAYYRRFESASEEDLLSLLEDLQAQQSLLAEENKKADA